MYLASKMDRNKQFLFEIFFLTQYIATLLYLDKILKHVFTTDFG